MYVGSVDGFGANDFHRKCDNKINTVILIKANNFWFGGYTTHQWGKNNGNNENKGRKKNYSLIYF